MKRNENDVTVAVVRERCAWRCLTYSRWEPYLAKFSKQLVPRLGAEAVMLGLSVVKGALEPSLEGLTRYETDKGTPQGGLVRY